MARDPRETYRAILALAEDPRTPEHERANARAAAERLEARYGPDALPGREAPEATRILAYVHQLERHLAARVARFHGLEPRRTGYARDDGKGTRWRDSITITGPADLVELAAEAYARHRATLAELLEFTTAGYVDGAFPLPPTDTDTDTTPVADHLVDAYRAASRAGDAHQDRRALTTTPEAP
jgi:hypothetical protein